MSFRNPVIHRHVQRRGMLYRYIRILGGMAIVVSILTLLEILLLSRTGRLELAESVRSASVLGVSFDADGRGAVSRVLLTWPGWRRIPFERRLFLHQLESSDPFVPWIVNSIGSTNLLGAVALSPNGRWLAIVRQPDSILISPGPHQGEETHFATTPGRSIGMVAWSSDGDRLLAIAGNSLFIWEFDTKQLVKQLPFEDPLLPFVSLSENGELALIATNDKVMVVDLETCSWSDPIRFPLGVAAGSLSSDGEFFVVTTRAKGFWLAARPNGQRLWRRESEHLSCGFVAIPDGDDCIAIVERRYDARDRATDVVLLLAPGSGEVVTSFAPEIGRLTGLQFRYDGTLCIWSDQGVIATWSVGEVPRELSKIDYLSQALPPP
jgi:WD40 repeat protein